MQLRARLSVAAAVLLLGTTLWGYGQSSIFVRSSTGAGTNIPAKFYEKLAVGLSTDGLEWQWLYTNPVLTDFSRDASIIRHHDEFVTVFTSAFNSTNPTFGLARSKDLINWVSTNVVLTGPSMTNTPNNTWAPEWFVEDGRYFVLVRSGQAAPEFTGPPLNGNPNYAPPGIGYLECLDPGTWTNWTDFTVLPDLQPTYENDPFVIKVGSTYHLFTDHYMYPGGPAILHRTSTNGPFSGYGPPVNIATNFNNAPAYLASGLSRSSPWEGQFVLPLGGDRYRLYFQATWYDASFAIESTNGMQSWDNASMQRLVYDGQDAYGHGSVIAISAAETLLPLAALARRADESVTKVQAIQTSPNVYNLYTSSQYEANRAAGRSDVLANPPAYGLFTSNSIMDLNLGGVMLQKSGSNAVVNLQLQTTPDLSASFTNHGESVPFEVNLPGDKHFLRIRALGP